MGNRSVGRELAFKAIFQLSFEKASIDEIMAKLMEDEEYRGPAK